MSYTLKASNASIPEIAKALGINKSTVSRNLRSGLKKLEVLRNVADDIRAHGLNPPIIGCGSVECLGDWIDRNGDYFEL